MTFNADKTRSAIFHLFELFLIFIFKIWSFNGGLGKGRGPQKIAYDFLF